MKKRRSNRAKQFVRACRNNGQCAYCRSNRTHSNVRRLPAPDGKP